MIPTLLLALVVSLFAASARAADATVVVMLFDGFSPRYLESFPAPTFQRLRTEGAYTHTMEPAFPSISLVNAVTISTGCWPAHHGIVSNLFLDPKKGLYDHSSDADWLLACEHLHLAAERQGARSATFGWVGRTSGTRGALASTMPAGEASYADYPDDSGRAAQVVAELSRPPAERSRLILAYFKGPDGAGHFAGMDAPETRAAVETADAAVNTVLTAIDAQPDADAIHLIVTTDHGMVPVTQVVNIARILRRNDIAATPISSGTTSFLYFEGGDRAAIDAAFEKLSAYSELDVARREALPADWNLGTSERVGQLVVSAHPPYFIEDIERWPWFLRFLGYVGPDFLDSSATLHATHGYPASTPGVEGILYARGRAFARGREVERVRAIDVHPTVMRVLGLEPGDPVDGRVESALLAGTR